MKIIPEECKDLFDQLPFGVLTVDPNGKILSLNQKMFTIFYEITKEPLGRCIYDRYLSLCDLELNPISNENHPTRLAIKEKKQVGPLTLGVTIQESGALYWTKCTNIPLMDETGDVTCVYIILEDAEIEVKRKRAYDNLFNEMLDGFALHEVIYEDQNRAIDYKFLAVNQAFREITGLLNEVIVGKTVLELMPETDQYWIDIYGDVALTGKQVWFEQFSTALNRYFEVKAYSPEPGKFATIFTDITKRVEDEQALRQQISDRESDSKIKSQFIANFSHEVRTPLNSILGILTLLEYTELNDEQIEYIQMAQNASHGLLNMVENILSFSAIESGKLTLNSSEFSLNEVVNQSILFVKEKAKQKDIKIGLTREGDVPDVFIGDGKKLGQVFTNLLTNSVKFTSGGKINIQFSGDAENDLFLLQVVVSDTGIGMSESFMETLFMPFAQQETPNKELGTGLGLSIVKEIVTLMGGAIEVKSQLGIGTQVFFQVPLKLN